MDIVEEVSEIDGDGQVAHEVGGEESMEKEHSKEEHVDMETEQRDQTPNWEVDNPQEREPEKGTITKDDHGTRMNTRCKGKKHVNVYETKLAVSRVKSILKNVSYTKYMNSNLTLFRTLDKSSFYAHQKELRNHRAICQDNLCDICTYIAKVADYTWDLKNYARYLTPMANKLQPQTLKQKKTVHFSKSDVREKIVKGLSLNVVSVECACNYNVSLSETRLLSVKM